ncbi:MAG: aminotransferase class I/II-fold pyridoxal phosphate-dependent enzyme [Blautia sp.]|nr:aminotransferase class I/II-fold pyridoxal phosphate-dependent enzyme [Blautia sp.]
MKWGHGGDLTGYELEYGRPPLDFSANICPTGCPENIRRAAAAALEDCAAYPDPFCRELRNRLSDELSIPAEFILCGNGASDLIYRLALALKPERALITAPAFSEYRAALETVGCLTDSYMLDEKNDFSLTEEFTDHITPDIDVVFLCQPNNPTGKTIDPGLLKRIAEKCHTSGCMLVVDECFLDFLDDPEHYSLLPELKEYPVVLLRAFTKFYGMAGIRLGYCISADALLLSKMAACGPPWTVSSAAQAAGIAALEDREFPQQIRKLIKAQRNYLRNGLISAGFRVVEGEANFLLFYGDENLGERLKNRGILIRDCRDFEGLPPGWYRIAVKTAPDNERLIETLRML